MPVPVRTLRPPTPYATSWTQPASMSRTQQKGRAGGSEESTDATTEEATDEQEESAGRIRGAAAQSPGGQGSYAQGDRPAQAPRGPQGQCCSQARGSRQEGARR